MDVPDPPCCKGMTGLCEAAIQRPPERQQQGCLPGRSASSSTKPETEAPSSLTAFFNGKGASNNSAVSDRAMITAWLVVMNRGYTRASAG